MHTLCTPVCGHCPSRMAANRGRMMKVFGSVTWLSRPFSVVVADFDDCESSGVEGCGVERLRPARSAETTPVAFPGGEVKGASDMFRGRKVSYVDFFSF